VKARKCVEARAKVAAAKATFGDSLARLVKDCGVLSKEEEDKLAKRQTAQELLAEINRFANVGNFAQMLQPCRSLLSLEPSLVPFERCVIAACKFHPQALTMFTLEAPQALRESLRELCPAGK
jgi:hypothetical protein